MNRLPPLTAPSAASQAGRVVDAYEKAVETVATVTACAVLARSIPRELLPDELRVAFRRCAAAVRARLGWAEKERHTVVIRRQPDGGALYGENRLYDAARTYLGATTMDPRATQRLSLATSRVKEPDGTVTGSGTIICMEPGCSTVDVFEGVVFTWTCVVDTGGEDRKRGGGGPREVALELSFDAEHTDTALKQYVPYVISRAVQLQLQRRALMIFMNEGRSWHGISHHHPATFDTLAMDLALKKSIVDDLDLFLKRRDYYRRIGKAWKRGYLLHGPPGTGKSSLVAAMANYLCFNLYDLDLSTVHSNSMLQSLLTSMTNKSILVIEDIDCCFHAAASREDGGKAPKPGNNDPGYSSDPDEEPMHHPPETLPAKGISLSGLLNFIDGLCEVTPAAVSEMLLRSEDAGVALQAIVEFLKDKKQRQ
ncbi:unnamed protein product [Urochloa decumbens]|uniref:AAA+ ATPase domain-containing protein n=1 Tax=Urochloa decumbens TaxID=240449 RepID=A0ABC9GVL5_9POAL